MHILYIDYRLYIDKMHYIHTLQIVCNGGQKLKT